MSGLVQCRHPDVLEHLVDLLADPEKPARIGAARALAHLGREEGALLLRLEAHHGDADIEVLSECFGALVQLGPSSSVAHFLGGFLDSPDPAVAQAAAVAVGETRHDVSFEIQRRAWERHRDVEFRRAVFAGMARSRLGVAHEFLLSILASESRSPAEAALIALGPFLYNEQLAHRVDEIVEGRGEH